MRFLIAEAFWADWHQYLSTAQSQWRLGRQIFDTLVMLETPDVSAFSPGLAESWSQIDDTTWEFVLRQGVTFHDGQPFTAADVKASVELATGATAEQTTTASRWVPTTVEVVDDFTARLVTSTPFAPALIELAQLPILSAADIIPSDRSGDAVGRHGSAQGASQRHRTVQALQRRAEREDDGRECGLLGWRARHPDAGLGVHPGCARPA